MGGETKGVTLYPECDYRLHIPTRLPKPGEPTRRINLGDALRLAIAFYQEQETLKTLRIMPFPGKGVCSNEIRGVFNGWGYKRRNHVSRM